MMLDCYIKILQVRLDPFIFDLMDTWPFSRSNGGKNIACSLRRDFLLLLLLEANIMLGL